VRAIVHSIHSQVMETVAGLRLREILSLDSHLDVSLGGDPTVYPPALRAIVQRTSVHALMREVSGGVPALGSAARRDAPRVVVAIPERMLARHASEVEAMLPRSLRTSDPEESVASVVDFLRERLGIEVHASPPESLTALLPEARAAGPWLLDIDVDCMQEMQDECFTQIRGAAKGVLQPVSSVVEFVRASKPENITVSEAMTGAIRDPGSNFSAFVRALQGIGYVVEERGVYESDAEVIRGIDDCREFYLKVSRPLMKEHMGSMMRGDNSGFESEERLAAREFFRRKGYLG
jgi:hypothetical protein